MSKLIMLRGLPSSGKSTKAKELLDDDNYKRINRDSLREMIDNGKWSKNNEKLIVVTEKALATLYINDGFNVIIDDCNLAPSTQDIWKDLAFDLGVTFETIDFTHVPLQECIKRDQKRPNYVGEKVIKRMYNDFLSKPIALPAIQTALLPRAILSDLDGTLALHTSGRSPYDTGKCGEDTLNQYVYNLIRVHLDTTHLIIVSGRSEEFRKETTDWLATNKVDWYKLFMRPAGDTRSDEIVKREIYEQHIQGKYHVVAVFDDRLRVARVWHNLGLPLFRCGDPDSDF